MVKPKQLADLSPSSRLISDPMFGGRPSFVLSHLSDLLVVVVIVSLIPLLKSG